MSLGRMDLSTYVTEDRGASRSEPLEIFKACVVVCYK